jgi:tRNA threonylcarbamoyladenosine biosynthesis protein TsaE
MNIYPTKPETVHFDFYRTEGMGLDGTMEEYIYDATRLCIAEWIDYLPEHLWPDDHLLIRWSMDGTRRRLSLTSKGPQGNHLLEHLGRLNQAASS